MRLFIAEKPSVARAIAAVLGVASHGSGFTVCKDGSYVTSCFGHMLELDEPDSYTPDNVPRNKKGKKIWRMQELPIIPAQWRKVIKHGAGERLKVIAGLLKKASVVVNAGDPDREGQNLVDEVIEKYKYKGKTERYWQSAMDDTSVKRALKAIVPNSTYYNWGVAAEARGRADWLIGMNLSRTVTVHQHGGLISVGRVQTPVLRLVADRDAAVENFKAHPFYTVIGKVKASRGSFNAKLSVPEKYLNSESQLTDSALAGRLAASIKGRKGTLTALNLQHKSAKAPLAWTLTSLSAECSKLLKFSAKKTLDCAQKLYEEYKLTSYPRSSCEYLPLAQQGDVPQILKNLLGAFPELKEAITRAAVQANYMKSRIWNDAATKKSAHTGIVPTLEKPTPAKLAALDPDCRKVYEIVAKRYIAAFLPPCLYDQVTPSVTLDDGSVLTASAKWVTDPGWKAVYGGSVDEDQDKKRDDPLGEQHLPALTQGEAVQITGSEVKEGKTKPPARFTEGTLMMAMKNISKEVDDPEEKKLLRDDDGIGTEATRAQIIETLKTRKFLALQKGKIISTPAGRAVLKVIPRALQSASLTAKTERELIKVQEGTLDLETFLETQKKELKVFMTEATNIPAAGAAATGGKPRTACPKCGKSENFWRDASRKNPGTFYWHCKDCGAYFEDDHGKPGKYNEPPVTAECPSCKGKAYRNESKKTPGTFYWKCSKCGTYFSDDNGKLGKARPVSPSAACPKCGKGKAYRLESKKNPGTFYWHCKDCDTWFNDDNGKIGAERQGKYKSVACPHCHEGQATRWPNKKDPSKFHWHCNKCGTSFFDKDGEIGDEFTPQG